METDSGASTLAAPPAKEGGKRRDHHNPHLFIYFKNLTKAVFSKVCGKSAPFLAGRADRPVKQLNNKQLRAGDDPLGRQMWLGLACRKPRKEGVLFVIGAQKTSLHLRQKISASVRENLV